MFIAKTLRDWGTEREKEEDMVDWLVCCKYTSFAIFIAMLLMVSLRFILYVTEIQIWFTLVSESAH